MARRETRRSTTPEIRDRIAERLRAAQRERALNTEELAQMTGISLRLVQKHRAGDNSPNFDSLSRYSAALGKPVAWFLTEDAA